MSHYKGSESLIEMPQDLNMEFILPQEPSLGRAEEAKALLI